MASHKTTFPVTTRPLTVAKSDDSWSKQSRHTGTPTSKVARGRHFDIDGDDSEEDDQGKAVPRESELLASMARYQRGNSWQWQGTGVQVSNGNGKALTSLRGSERGIYNGRRP